jgi:hypothetical protein
MNGNRPQHKPRHNSPRRDAGRTKFSNQPRNHFVEREFLFFVQTFHKL